MNEQTYKLPTKSHDITYYVIKEPKSKGLLGNQSVKGSSGDLAVWEK